MTFIFLQCISPGVMYMVPEKAIEISLCICISIAQKVTIKDGSIYMYILGSNTQYIDNSSNHQLYLDYYNRWNLL